MRCLGGFLITAALLIPTLVLAENNTAQNNALDQVRYTPESGTVTLTFDDGPDPTYTPRVLEILKKYNIKATFFVIGELAQQHPDILRRIVSEGHAVANHSWSHPKLNHLNEQQLYHQVVGTQEAVETAIGMKPVCLRPPYGQANDHVKGFLRSQNIIPIPLGFNSFDYERRGVDRLTKWVLSKVHPNQVILFHDGNNSHGQTMDALPAIIEGIKSRGIGFSAICYPPNYAEARAKILAASSAPASSAPASSKPPAPVAPATASSIPMTTTVVAPQPAQKVQR